MNFVTVNFSFLDLKKLGLDTIRIAMYLDSANPWSGSESVFRKMPRSRYRFGYGFSESGFLNTEQTTPSTSLYLHFGEVDLSKISSPTFLFISFGGLKEILSWVLPANILCSSTPYIGYIMGLAASLWPLKPPYPPPPPQIVLHIPKTQRDALGINVYCLAKCPFLPTLYIWSIREVLCTYTSLTTRSPRVTTKRTCVIRFF